MRNRLRNIAMAAAIAGCAIGSWNGLSHAQGQTAPDQRIDQSRSDQGLSGSPTTGLAPSTSSVTLPAGVKAKDNPAAVEAIRDVFRTMVNAAARGDMNKLAEQLSAPDRDRIEGFAKKVPEDFMSSVRGFGNLWQTRYGGRFNITKKEVFGEQFFSVATGEISDSSAMTDWPVNPSQQFQASSEQRDRTSLLNRKYLAKGRDVAVVVIPGQADLPELTVSMVHEAPDFWKVDIPDNIDGPTLTANLKQHVDQLTASSGQWPPAGEEGSRLAARHILMALYGVPATQSGGTGTSGSTGSTTQPGSAGSTSPYEGGASTR